MRKGMWRFSAGFVLLMGGATMVHGLQQSRPQTTPSYEAAPPDLNDPSMARLHEQQKVAMETERHKRMVADSDKLLQLATELKVEVERSTRDEMSVAAIKKAGDIEKLAHDVKERMKGN